MVQFRKVVPFQLSRCYSREALKKHGLLKRITTKESNYEPTFLENLKTFKTDNYIVLEGVNHSPRGREHNSIVTEIVQNSSRVITGEELKDLCLTFDESVLGSIPPDFLSPLRDNAFSILQRADFLENPKNFSVTSGTNFSVSYVSSGEIKDVYCLKIDNKEYALKIYKNRDSDFRPNDLHSCHSEISIGLYTNSLPVKNIEYLHFGNPELGYTVCEWLPKDEQTSFRMGGRLEDYGLVHRDPKPENEINGVLCDLGGISKMNANDIAKRKVFNYEYEGKNKKVSYLNFEKCDFKRLETQEILKMFKALWFGLPSLRRALIFTSRDLIMDKPELLGKILDFYKEADLNNLETGIFNELLRFLRTNGFEFV